MDPAAAAAKTVAPPLFGASGSAFMAIAADEPTSQSAHPQQELREPQPQLSTRPLPIMVTKQHNRHTNCRPTEIIRGKSMVNINGSMEEGWGEAERLLAQGQGTPPLLHMVKGMPRTGEPKEATGGAMNRADDATTTTAAN